jgi:hypothetical protein
VSYLTDELYRPQASTLLGRRVLLPAMPDKDETLARLIVRALQDYPSTMWRPLSIIVRRLALTDIGAIEAALTFGRDRGWIEDATNVIRCIQLTDVGQRLP